MKNQELRDHLDELRRRATVARQEHRDAVRGALYPALRAFFDAHPDVPGVTVTRSLSDPAENGGGRQLAVVCNVRDGSELDAELLVALVDAGVTADDVGILLGLDTDLGLDIEVELTRGDVDQEEASS